MNIRLFTVLDRIAQGSSMSAKPVAPARPHLTRPPTCRRRGFCGGLGLSGRGALSAAPLGTFR